ncbi:rho GTPase-activating protein 40 [Polypterus senegalus]|nr:rho GTPase-activating protein 40 [Polypterus senegalus]
MNLDSWTNPSCQLNADNLYFHSSLSDAFWNEVESIWQGGSISQTEGSMGSTRQPEEGELEKAWLQDAGLSTLIGEDCEDVDNMILLSTLTRTQAAAVQRRLNTYTCSIKKKRKQPIPDVRDIFGSSSLQKTLPETEDSISNDQHLEEVMGDMPQCPIGEKEEIFITDVPYCEQAALLVKQGKTADQDNQRKKNEAMTLPKLVSPKYRLGVTRIGDLSSPDVKKIRQLALIDMTALCDLLQVELKRSKSSRNKISEGCLFGVPLATLLENDQKIHSNATIPLLLEEMLSFLEEKALDSEGILRVSGSQSRIKSLQQRLENTFYLGLFKWEEVNPNDGAALLKKFIRDLPVPLLTAEYLHTFSAVGDIPYLQQRLHVLNLLVLLLPDPNRNTLKALLEFLRKVVLHEKSNRMNLWSVSTIMAPNLFFHKSVDTKLSGGREKVLAERAADIMRLLLQYQDLLWTIPCFLMSQVRKLNENSSRRYQFYDRRIKNLLKKIYNDRHKAQKCSAEPHRTVKIQTGLQQNDVLKIELNVDSLAADVLEQYHKQLNSQEANAATGCGNGSVEKPEIALYEVGGNIGEHCVDPTTFLLDLYNNNPGAEWIIKQRQPDNKRE